MSQAAVVNITSKALPSILVIDDTHDNIRLLSDCLKPNYEVLAANNGEKGLAIAQRFKPDLILLDIMMPGLNGYDVCERLKSNPETADIPVIFLTALYESNDEYKGLKAGAVDYISKPFNPYVLNSRIETQLKLRKAQKELKNRSDNLEVLVKKKTHELEEAHKHLKILDSTKQDFLTVISHELRTPINGVLGFAELAFTSLEANEENELNYQAFEQSRNRLIQMIDNAMLLAELQSQDNHLAMESTEVLSLLKSAVNDKRSYADQKNIGFDTMSVEQSEVQVNERLIKSSLETLIHAVINLAHADSVIRMKGIEVGNRYHLQISFNGFPLSDATIESFFDVFSTQRSNSHVEELGLGLPLASRIIESLGGEVAIRNADTETLEINLQLKSAH